MTLDPEKMEKKAHIKTPKLAKLDEINAKTCSGVSTKAFFCLFGFGFNVSQKSIFYWGGWIQTSNDICTTGSRFLILGP